MQKHIFILYMKDFIQYKLRILLEGRLATHTRANPSGPTYNAETTRSQYHKALADIEQAKNIYNSLSGEQQKMLGDVYTGDGLYEIQLSKNGDLKGTNNRINHKAEAGTYNDPNPNKRYFYIAANRGISHPEYDDDTREGYIVGKSPMTDAILKLRVFMSNDIISFLESGLGYLDDKGKEIQKSKMTPDEILKLANKEEKNKQKAMKKKGYFGSELDLISQKSILNKRVAELRSKSIITKLGPEEREELIDLKSEIKLIDKQLKEKEAQMNKIRSGSKNI